MPPFEREAAKPARTHGVGRETRFLGLRRTPGRLAAAGGLGGSGRGLRRHVGDGLESWTERDGRRNDDDRAGGPEAALAMRLEGAAIVGVNETLAHNDCAQS
jgi:hypothetical protein